MAVAVLRWCSTHGNSEIWYSSHVSEEVPDEEDSSSLDKFCLNFCLSISFSAPKTSFFTKLNREHISFTWAKLAATAYHLSLVFPLHYEPFSWIVESTNFSSIFTLATFDLGRYEPLSCRAMSTAGFVEQITASSP